MDPVAQILEQGRTQESNVNLADYYFKGRDQAQRDRQLGQQDRRLGQEDRQINLSQQRLMLEEQQQRNANLMAPLQLEALRLGNDKLQTQLLTQHAEAVASVETLKGNLDMAQMVARGLAEGTLTTPEFAIAVNDKVQKNPYITMGQPYQQWAQQKQIGMASAKLTAQFGIPTSAAVVDKETGTQINYGQKTNPTGDVQDLQYLERLKQAVVTAPTSEARVAAQSALDDARVKLKVAPETTDATKAVQTRLEEQSAAAANAFTTAKQLIPFLEDKSNSGLMGLEQRAQESVSSLMGGKLGPNSATEAAAINTRLKSELIGMARADGNLARSEKQVEAIVSGMPDVTRWFHGASQAKVQLADAIGQIGDLSRANAKTLGKPVASEWLKPDEILNMFVAGKITRQQVDKLQQNNGWETIKQLRATAIK